VPVLSSIFLLSSAFSSQALTTQVTRNVINGSAPYLTFDGGRTRATNVDELLAITLPSGTRILPSTNTSSAANPIQLQRANVSSNDIGMSVPSNASSVPFSRAISLYWRDDDGDGQNGGIITTGDIRLSIVDRNGQPVARDDVFMTTVCGNNKAPYKLTLSFSGGRLSTRYGFPKDGDVFSPRSVAYYITPKAGSASPAACFAKPNLRYGSSSDESRYRGPSNIWNPAKGFLTQSTVPSGYHRNFPTTGAHNLYFDLLIEGVDARQLRWPSVTVSGITASMTPDSSGTSVRVTLKGPYATSSQIRSSSPGNIHRPPLPATFELVGRDSRGNAVIKYGFRLKQWFVNRGDYWADYATHNAWCSSIGYSMPRVRDLTNAVRTDRNPPPVGATPPSSNNNYTRHIDAGFFSEWGYMGTYTGARDAIDGCWTSDATGGNQFTVDSHNGRILWIGLLYSYFGVCASDLRP
jgi:hypothetical protein